MHTGDIKQWVLISAGVNTNVGSTSSDKGLTLGRTPCVTNYRQVQQGLDMKGANSISISLKEDFSCRKQNINRLMCLNLA